MANGRARKGGEVGVNGEFYEGGKFLPSTEQPKRSVKRAPAKVAKVEIAPYVWEVAPEGKQSIYRKAAPGVFVNVRGGRMVFVASEQVLAYYKGDRAEIERLCELWNSGERWI